MYYLTINKVDLSTPSRFLPNGFCKLDTLHMVVEELNDIIYWYNVTMALEMYKNEQQNVSVITHSSPQDTCIPSLAATTPPVLKTDSTASILHWFNHTNHSIYWYNNISVNQLITVDRKFKAITGMAGFYLNYEMKLPVSFTMR